MLYWIEWVATYEDFMYSELVTEEELANRQKDNTIQIFKIEPFIEE